MENQNMEAIMRNNNSISNMWKRWDIRAFMIVSLLIQVMLTTLAPLRKRSSNSILSFSLWLLYLSADAVALFTIGKISSDPGQDRKQEGIFPFWSPFLLLHLGGPDTITALALADNELWHRHALSLATQVIITFYVFGRSLKKGYFQLLWIPTLLMLIDGCTKYIERTCALYFASSDSFRDSLSPTPEAGPNYARLVEEYSSAKSANLPMIIHGIGGPSDETLESQPTEATDNMEDDSLRELKDDDKLIEKVKIAYYFYNKFKGLLVDAILSLKDKNQSRSFFKNKDPIEFAKIVTTELHFMYDIFYTKLFLINKKLQYVRPFCFLSVIASLVLFSLEDKRNYYEVDVTITFALLGGAIALDICALVMFIMSDWWIIITFIYDRARFTKAPMKMLYEWTKCSRAPKCCRCDRSISSYNLLERCFKIPPFFVKLIRIKRVKDIFIGWMYVRTKTFDDTSLAFIIKELQIKADKATDNETTKQVCSSRGNLVLQEDYYLISECLSPWTTDIDYDESLLIWHLATDICYRTSGQEATPDQTTGTNTAPDLTNGQNATPGQTSGQNATPDETSGQNATPDQTIGQNATPDQTIGQDATLGGQNATPGQTSGQNATPDQTIGQNATPGQTSGQNATPGQTIGHQNATPDQTNGEKGPLDHRDFSKKLSDYMLYLLLKQEGLMSPVVGISDIRFKDTRAEAEKFYKNKKLYYWSKEFWDKMVKKVSSKCCSSTEIHQGDTTPEPPLLKEFCEDVLKVKSILKPIVAKGDKSKSVLFDACRLAKQLKMFKERQWEITSKVWVELLGYAAIRCQPRSHLSRLNQGGELITLVWLCMAQLGLSEHFGQNQGFGWTKLILEQD